jgi:hypothetical protein
MHHNAGLYMWLGAADSGSDCLFAAAAAAAAAAVCDLSRESFACEVGFMPHRMDVM